MTFDDLRTLNFKDLGNWPLLPKMLALTAIVIVIVALGYLFDWKDQWDALEQQQNEEVKLKEQYAQKKAKAINFELYVQQLNEVEQSFGALVKQLPNRSEIDALLTDINQAGSAAACSSSSSGRRSRRRWRSSTPSCRSRSRSRARTTTWARSRATWRSFRAS
jgi:Tfp pilus assembly protein PilO